MISSGDKSDNKLPLIVENRPIVQGEIDVLYITQSLATDQLQHGISIEEELPLERITSLQQMDEKLNAKRKEALEEKEKLLQKISEFEVKQTQFKERKQKFSNFIQENEVKSKKANERYEKEKVMIATKIIEIEQMKSLIEQQNESLQRSHALLKKTRKYEEFLKQLLAITSNSNGIKMVEISEILFRYETLKEAKSELKQSLATTLSQINLAKETLSKIQAKNDSEYLTYSSQKSFLQYSVEQARSKLIDSKALLETNVGKYSQSQRDYSSIRLAIDNLMIKIEEPLLASDSISYTGGESNLVSAEDKLSRISFRILDIERIVERTKNILQSNK